MELVGLVHGIVWPVISWHWPSLNVWGPTWFESVVSCKIVFQCESLSWSNIPIYCISEDGHISEYCIFALSTSVAF